VQSVPKGDRLADPVAEGRVIGAGQDTVGGQAIRRRTHVASISDRPHSSWNSSRQSCPITIYGCSLASPERLAQPR
jgi:hypothetical protein